MIDLLTFIGGAALTGITLVIKDAVMKNTFKHEIKSLHEAMGNQDRINKEQEGEIRRLREDALEMKTTMSNFKERFDDFYRLQKEEVKSLQGTLNETNQRFASLDATLIGLSKWLARVEKKLETNI